MALPASGPLSSSQIATELGVPSTNISLGGMSDSASFSAPDAISDFYGYSAATEITMSLSVSNYMVYNPSQTEFDFVGGGFTADYGEYNSYNVIVDADTTYSMRSIAQNPAGTGNVSVQSNDNYGFFSSDSDSSGFAEDNFNYLTPPDSSGSSFSFYVVGY